ncbi:hypothetical protein HF1_07860 [Mycoplasma haemofelis str. Langford 1]|uniref:Uncharacterized protein n=1 Tax=Mycoplasma haemofelis (strain Langford 1) TaxID=941640 RepID=E8ZI23_MYCHL|nr:hypothetical protein [Mycoplasma haemofelis]CBY92794.1 hypothetical protein HF1_07860 [Mycoplasma haemofelis str. Langford 1]
MKIIPFPYGKSGILPLIGCYGVPCGAVYFLLNKVLSKEEAESPQDLITQIKFEQTKDTPSEAITLDTPLAQEVPENARAKVIDTVNNQYLTEENRKRQGWKFTFNGHEYFRIPKLSEVEKWKEVLKQFREGSLKDHSIVKSLTDEEGIQKYCLEEVKWEASTVNLDLLASSPDVPSSEYLCIWDHFKHQKQNDN